MNAGLIIFSIILVIVVLVIIAVIQHNREEDRKEAVRLANENTNRNIKRYITDQRKAAVSNARRSQREGTEFMRAENIVSISQSEKVARKSYGLTKEKAERISMNTRSAYDCDYDSAPSRQTSRSSRSHSYSDSGSSGYSSSDSGSSCSSSDSGGSSSSSCD